MHMVRLRSIALRCCSSQDIPTGQLMIIIIIKETLARTRAAEWRRFHSRNSVPVALAWRLSVLRESDRVGERV